MTQTVSLDASPPYSGQPAVTIRIPKYLFRYLRDDANLVPSLAEPYLWFSQRAALNDPFELSARFKGGNSYPRLASLLRRVGNSAAKAKRQARHTMQPQK